jgi:hypothetical protein
MGIPIPKVDSFSYLFERRYLASHVVLSIREKKTKETQKIFCREILFGI